MYHVIGLKQDGKLTLVEATNERPLLEHLEGLAKDFAYSQLLVIDGAGGGQLARFEVLASPPAGQLRQVDLA